MVQIGGCFFLVSSGFSQNICPYFLFLKAPNPRRAVNRGGLERGQPFNMAINHKVIKPAAMEPCAGVLEKLPLLRGVKHGSLPGVAHRVVGINEIGQQQRVGWRRHR